ncbi:MAG: heat-shock protein Hsp20 [Gammaproteobacteria bacterium RIFCSPLOWO2_02_FULL_52_10]|nr:MAG: heat-shock protein Hsp20 [Gammaproteobacteria bacterium RIFCSPLOWO2_02_FULL_52_10]
MSLVRYEPLNLLDRFQKEFKRMGLLDPFINEVLSDDNTDVAISHWRPAVDIKEEDNRFLIKADIPGVDPKNIEITMEDGVLTIKGERTSEKEEKREDFRRVERSRGTFYRRFSLPDTADAEKIEANGRDGVLEIVIPKQDKVLPRRITVKS